MNNDKKKLIIKIAIAVSVVALLIVGIYALIVINREKNDEYKLDIFTYLTTTHKNETLSSKSPLLGLLNYNFSELGDTNTINTDVLIKSNILHNSMMNSVGIDNIYSSKFGTTKSGYESKENYVSVPETNCYYMQNVLKKSGYNCDSVCSQSTINIMKSMQKTLKWDNILPEDAKTYCIKNALFSIENGYFVNLNDAKELFKDLTGKELSFQNDITSNSYYSFNAVLINKLDGLQDSISSIVSVDDVSASGDTYEANYTALTSENKELKGMVTLKKVDTKYYIVANEIETTYNLNS